MMPMASFDNTSRGLKYSKETGWLSVYFYGVLRLRREIIYVPSLQCPFRGIIKPVLAFGTTV